MPNQNPTVRALPQKLRERLPRGFHGAISITIQDDVVVQLDILGKIRDGAAIAELLAA